MMIALRKFISDRFRHGFWSKDDGAVLTEALVAVPFITLFAAGVLEFGNIFWERMQIDAGLRDAGRYLSRCRPDSGTYDPTCNAATAKMIAFYGTQSPPRMLPCASAAGARSCRYHDHSRQCRWHDHGPDFTCVSEFADLFLARHRSNHHQILSRREVHGMVKRRSPISFWQDEHGVTLTEGLITLPLVLLAISAFVEFGYAMSQWNQTVKALQFGARLAAVSDPLTSDFADVFPTDAVNPLDNGDATPNDATISSTCGPNLANCSDTLTRIVMGNDGVCGVAGDPNPGICDINWRIQPKNLVVTYQRSGSVTGAAERTGANHAAGSARCHVRLATSWPSAWIGSDRSTRSSGDADDGRPRDMFKLLSPSILRGGAR